MSGGPIMFNGEDIIGVNSTGVRGCNNKNWATAVTSKTSELIKYAQQELTIQENSNVTRTNNPPPNKRRKLNKVDPDLKCLKLKKK